jgi:hypothetical protein
MAAMATKVKRPALIWPTLSPKFNNPIASPPRMTVKLSHERKVRSLAKKTFGSTRVGRAMRLPGESQWMLKALDVGVQATRCSLEERLGRHDDVWSIDPASD